MSVVKLLSRIVAPNEYIAEGRDLESTLHDHTYGITSDPLTQFATVFSALIHDADHAGVSNAQLVKERSAVALQYKDKSVLEQNSVDLAWHLLMNNDYKQLRATIYQTDGELKRFRQLVVNSVMATDIVVSVCTSGSLAFIIEFSTPFKTGQRAKDIEESSVGPGFCQQGYGRC